MRHRRPSRGWWCFCVGWSILSLPLARASAEFTPAPTSSATSSSTLSANASVSPEYEQLIDDALRAYEAGRFAEARNTFRRAHELSPTARTLRTIGMCSFNLGDYPDAVWHLESALLDSRKPLTEDQRKHVADLITKSNVHIGRYRLRLEPAEAELSVDGRPALVLAGSELLLETGHRQIEVRARGYRPARSSLQVDGADRTTLVFALERESGGLPADANLHPDLLGAENPTGPRVEGQGERGHDASGSVVQTLGIVSLSLGGASLVGFGVVGGLALAEKGRLDDRCPDTRCARSLQSDVDRYDALRTAATATLIAGGALAAIGVSLLLLAPSERATARSGRAQAHAAWVPIVGLGTVGLRGEL